MRESYEISLGGITLTVKNNNGRVYYQDPQLLTWFEIYEPIKKLVRDEVLDEYGEEI